MSHIDDGDLIRLADGECSPDERADIEEHLAACAGCAARRDALGQLSQALTAALAGESLRAPQIAPPGPAEHRRGYALRAAVVLLVVIAATASAQPVRDWVVERLRALHVLPPPAPPAEHDTGTQGSGPATVRFLATAPVFTIEVQTRQHAGLLTIRVTAETLATATVTAGRMGEELVVLPTGLRIVNRAGALASYDVRLPAGVTDVRLRIAGEPERRVVPIAGSAWSTSLVVLRRSE